MNNTYLVETNCACSSRCRCSSTNKLKTAQHHFNNLYYGYRHADDRIHYAQPQTLYGTDAQGNRYVSNDSGRSWRLVQTYPGQPPRQRAAPQPRAPHPTKDPKYHSPTPLGQTHVAPKYLDQRFAEWIKRMLDEPTYEEFASKNKFPRRVNFPKTQEGQRKWWNQRHLGEKYEIWHFVIASDSLRRLDQEWYWLIKKMLNEGKYYDGFAEANGFPDSVAFPKTPEEQHSWWLGLTNDQKWSIQKFVHFWERRNDEIRKSNQKKAARAEYVPVAV
jgi:hypothetical protein